MNLTISKGYISSDAGWFMDVFHVKDAHGNKLTDQRVINYIQQAIGTPTREARKAKPCTSKQMLESQQAEAHSDQHTAIEMTGTDHPGLFSEISAALAEMHCNIVEAHAWSHNARLACVAYISDQSTDSPFDRHRLAAIEDHLTTVLRATTSPAAQVKTAAGLREAEGTMMTSMERRLHQLMLSVRDFDRPSRATSRVSPPRLGGDEGRKKGGVWIESCSERGYSIVSVQCRDRPRLMFDTVCTLTDMQYVIFHASVDSREGYAFQEYFIRHVDGCALNTEGEEERVINCLEAAIERRVCEGVRLELRAKNRVGLLSDITRVLRENGLAVVRADVATQGGKSVNAFYLRDVSGKDVDMDFVESVKREMGPIDLAVKNEESLMPMASSDANQRSRFSISGMLKSQIERFSHNFVAIK
ncbi:ACT domain-containing protein ACR2 isoform X2 [Diospyros lotus]|nr:ACT domain-containing protein ACR2 isoform X2 [Diospyros lotus]